ncbi:MAG: hypothetical protein WCG91_04335 [Candidatus Shapirobacteria bacterium]
MSKEIEQIKQIIENHNFQRQVNIENIGDRDAEIKMESEKRSLDNKKILEDSGIVTLFEEIRDTGLLKYRLVKPIDGKNDVPARIVYGQENESISICFNSSNSNSEVDREGKIKIKIKINVCSGGVVLVEKIREKGYFRTAQYNHISIDKENIAEVVGNEIAKYNS